MSNKQDDIFADEVLYHIDYWAGEGIGKFLKYSWDHHHYDQVVKLMKESREAMFEHEYRPSMDDYRIGRRNGLRSKIYIDGKELPF